MNKNVFFLKGINDLSIKEIKLWEYYLNILYDILNSFNYNKINLPILEKIEIFKNVINNKIKFNNFKKKTYNFLDKNKIRLVLNPEGTISCTKYYINNILYKNINNINKFYYFNPTFRYENTQYMRYRKFYQLGIEIFNHNNIEYDMELIYIINLFFKYINIDNFIILKINNIGNDKDKIIYCNYVIKYLKNKFNYNNNDYIIKEIKKYNFSIFYKKKKFFYYKKIPYIYNLLNNDNKNNFNKLINFLKSNNIKYNIDFFLFRGLDYYNNSIFEWTINNKKISICGGGRYDNLSKKIGYNLNISSLGLAIGWNRLIKLIIDNNINNKNTVTNNNIYINISCINFLCIYTMINIYKILYNNFKNIIINLDYSLKTLKKNLNISYKYNYDISILLYKLKNNKNIKIFIKNFKYKYFKISSLDNILKDLKI